ncbi:citrate synthase/methylcitrate synthase [Nitriliruptoraceae bacterium ZYF776]|nr:citrate synthase/methylcitrate synthase [Profundirhabdus halotolerans]
MQARGGSLVLHQLGGPTVSAHPTATTDRAELDVPPGLEGVAVVATATGEVLGRRGVVHYRGHDATELARRRPFEDVWHLLLRGHLPDATARAGFAAEVAAARPLPTAVARALPALAAAHGTDRLGGLRSALSVAASALALRPWGDDPAALSGDAVRLAALVPALIVGLEGHAEAAALDAPTAEGFLRALGHVPSPAQVEALDRYLTVTADHGTNASTFAARVVASTGADLGATVVAGLGALSGPLHGGAPSRALAMLDAIGSPQRAHDWVRARVRAGERIMGFGHRVYRTEDPRAALLRETAATLDSPRTELALAVERAVLEVLDEEKPGRELAVNVEFHAAVVLDAIGLPPALFTPTFAISRTVGWTAHVLEQAADNRLVRPGARYVGPAFPVPVPAA